MTIFGKYDPATSRIAVIGAGASGLSAAWYLKQKGYKR
ncbi:MAG: NAD(P)-binding protein [Oligoflexales bacterium]|nr:NAD(P)-binding protein [Oligoflexales bacterium]